MEDLTVNKICVDSRFRTAQSVSDTDFSIELPETVFLPSGTKCYVSEVSLVHAWYTVEKNQNNNFFHIREGQQQGRQTHNPFNKKL